MSKFPFTIYQVVSWIKERDVPIPPEEFFCKECGLKCGHTSNLIRHEKVKERVSYINELKVLGESEDSWFIELTYEDSYGRDSSDIEQFSKDDTNLYITKETAQRAIDSYE
jgi:hypothetical protein